MVGEAVFIEVESLDFTPVDFVSPFLYEDFIHADGGGSRRKSQYAAAFLFDRLDDPCGELVRGLFAQFLITLSHRYAGFRKGRISALFLFRHAYYFPSGDREIPENPRNRLSNIKIRSIDDNRIAGGLERLEVPLFVLFVSLPDIFSFFVEVHLSAAPPVLFDFPFRSHIDAGFKKYFYGPFRQVG